MYQFAEISIIPAVCTTPSGLTLGTWHSPLCLVTHYPFMQQPPHTLWVLGCWIQASPLQPDSYSLVEKRDQNTPKGVRVQRYAIFSSCRFKLDFCELLCQSVSCSLCPLLVPSVVSVGRCPSQLSVVCPPIQTSVFSTFSLYIVLVQSCFIILILIIIIKT